MNYWTALQKKIPQILIWIICLLILPKLVIFFLPFIIGAGIAALAVKPMRVLRDTLHLPGKVSALVVLLAMMGLVILILYLAGAKVLQQSLQWIEEMPILLGKVRVPARWEPLWYRIRGRMDEVLSVILQKISIILMNGLSGLAMQLPRVLMDTGICILSAYYFATEDRKISMQIKRYVPSGVSERLSMFEKALKDSMGRFLWAQVKIEMVIGGILWIGLLCLGIPYSFPIALVIAMTDLMPVLGTGTIMWPWAGMRALQGQYMSAVGLLILWTLTQVIRQIIQPMVLGKDVQISPLWALVLMYVGYKLGSVGGMILAIPLGVLARSVIHLEREKKSV